MAVKFSLINLRDLTYLNKLNAPDCVIFNVKVRFMFMFVCGGRVCNGGMGGGGVCAFALLILPRTFIWKHTDTPRTLHLPRTQKRVLGKRWLKTPKTSCFTILGGSALRGPLRISTLPYIWGHTSPRKYKQGKWVCVCVCSARHSKRGPESIFYIQSEDILTKRGQNFSPRFVTMCTVLPLP